MRETSSSFFQLTFIGSLFAALSFSSIDWAQAYPEFTRHRYSSCTACHVSPNGGGVLTPYGRNLSRELVSFAGSEREAEVGHGFLPKPWGEALETSKLRLGGNARWTQVHRENKTSKSGQFFFMQGEAEAAWDQGPWAVAISVGQIEDPRGRGVFHPYSSRYYGMYRIGEHLSLRAGRFMPAFGLNLADHTLSVRRTLQMGPEVEKNSFESAWIGEKHQGFFTLSNSSDATASADKEKSAAARYEYLFTESSRVGLSAYWGEGTDNRRWIVGTHSILQLSNDVFLSSEIDRQEKKDSSANTVTSTNTGFLRLHYEVAQGIIPLLGIQHDELDLNSSASETNKFGLGLWSFPRPHFEVFGIWNKVLKTGEWSDEAYLVLHYYL